MSFSNDAIPVVTGTTVRTHQLATTPGEWTSDDPLTYAYQWFRCDVAGDNCIEIPGAVGQTYVLAAADVGARLRSRVTPTEHPTPGDPPPGVVPLPGSGIITTAGAYQGDFAGQLVLDTTGAVTLYGSTYSYKGGTIIKTFAGKPPNLSIEHCRFDGGSYRILDCDTFDSIAMLNCAIEKTSGITLVGNGDVSILRNRHHNIQRTPGSVGNFVQLRVLQAGDVEIAWNENVNEYGQSNPEDLISLYHSSGAWVHDNMFWGQFHPGNGVGSSQNGITLDGYGGSISNPIPVNDNIIENNQLVRCLSIAVFPTASGPASGNRFLGNRYVNAGLLDDGVTRNYYGYQGMSVKPGGTDNEAHDNVLGAMKGTSQGAYTRGNDGEFSGEERGNGNGSTTGAWADNEHMAPIGGTITQAMEADEWDFWLQKLIDNSVVLGPVV